MGQGSTTDLFYKQGPTEPREMIQKIEKAALALIITSRRLQPYFQSASNLIRRKEILIKVLVASNLIRYKYRNDIEDDEIENSKKSYEDAIMEKSANLDEN
ncbi:hypothetical protein CR513_53896, partial [Mucuna pruriens]